MNQEIITSFVTNLIDGNVDNPDLSITDKIALANLICLTSINDQLHGLISLMQMTTAPTNAQLISLSDILKKTL